METMTLMANHLRTMLLNEYVVSSRKGPYSERGKRVKEVIGIISGLKWS